METILLKDAQKIFTLGGEKVHALDGVSLSIMPGDFVAVMGASGSGKSTLMNIFGCLDTLTSGEYLLEGRNVSGMDKKHLADIRNQRIGFVFQGFNLLPRTSALENVQLPLFYNRHKKGLNPKKLAAEALDRVGLANRMSHEPSQLSGGQQQRVAIARALVNDPAIILADEPTGNLDSKTTLDVLTLFKDLNQQGITIVLVTHEADVGEHAQRVIAMRDGKVISDDLNAGSKPPIQAAPSPVRREAVS
ncbi:ABC transporter related [Desulfatibacillum aliphaticivorans]|uniref:ABC transporter related n=1 Tax=Desulfatibacillum aliphaticivorans TaxID=218208 RepID=B8FDA5_DESAL|nr:ABC transporter ATP-binding protein [Desulfatibacillum aliphaticivorans]ACL06536.1 ABC transporter related [Desulfatibacillum aliphaticivorans]